MDNSEEFYKKLKTQLEIQRSCSQGRGCDLFI